MNDIALAAGVTKPVLYQHFDSKHDLFLELLTTTASELSAAIETAVDAASTGREKIENAFAAAVHFFGDTPANFRVFYGEGVRTQPEFAEAHRGLIESIHQFIADHIDIESLDRDHRMIAATAVAGQLEAGIGHWIDGGREQTADDVAELLASLAWRGLRGTN